MNYDFNKVVRSNSISIESIKNHASNHLSELQDLINNQKAMASNSEDISGNSEDEEDPVAEFGEDMIVNLVVLSALSSMLFSGCAFINGFNTSSAIACVEAISLMVEDRDNAIKGKLYDYPQGRISFKGGRDIASEGFKLASDAKKKVIKNDKSEDRKCMHELLKMSDKLEKEGVRFLEVEPDGNIYDTLRKSSKEIAYGGGIIRHASSSYIYGNA